MASKLINLIATASCLFVTVLGNADQRPSGAGLRLANFSCNGLPDDYYSHPSKCSSYIHCSDELRAFEFDCNMGANGKPLHFLTSRTPRDPLCGPPEVACCGCHKPSTTTSTTTTTTTPTTTTTTTTTTEGTTPAPGECDPELCKLDGYCNCYEVCVNGTDGRGHLVEKNCTEDLFWLPNDLTGGTCVYFGNLPDDIQAAYRDDSSCIEKCEWFQKPGDVCSPRYTYRKEFDGQTIIGREVDLSCPNSPSGKKPLYWVQSRLVCDVCDNAVDLDGNACSC